MGHIERSRIADTFCPDIHRYANHTVRQVGIVSMRSLGLTPRLVPSAALTSPVIPEI
jgi:hypothetical protein